VPETFAWSARSALRRSCNSPRNSKQISRLFHTLPDRCARRKSRTAAAVCSGRRAERRADRLHTELQLVSAFRSAVRLVFRPKAIGGAVQRGFGMTIPYASLVSGSLSYAQSVNSTTESTRITVSCPKKRLPRSRFGLASAGRHGALGDVYNTVIHNHGSRPRSCCATVSRGLEARNSTNRRRSTEHNSTFKASRLRSPTNRSSASVIA